MWFDHAKLMQELNRLYNEAVKNDLGGVAARNYASGQANEQFYTYVRRWMDLKATDELYES